jgi:hypothetical protein
MTTQPSPDKRGGAALCCQCGNLRTSPYGSLRGKRSDPNRTAEIDGDPRGWRMTRTLECPICEMPTVHAILCRGDRDLRDRAEEFVYKRASWMQG